jgi:hypothetical protein
VTAPKTYQDYINIHWDSAPDADPAAPQWVTVDLGAATDVNRVILKWNTAAAKDFKIQTSLDNTAWTDVFSTAIGSSYSVTDETFKTTSARYVRMYATTRAPIARGGRGGGGRGGRGAATTPAATGAATAAAPAAGAGPGGPGGRGGAPAAPTGYSLFDFQILKD